MKKVLPELNPWLRAIRYDIPSSVKDTSPTTMAEVIQWSRMVLNTGHASLAIGVLDCFDEQANASVSNAIELFFFVLSDLPANFETFAILERLARKFNTSNLLVTLASTCLGRDTKKATELLDVAKRYAPEDVVVVNMRAIIAEAEGRLDDALELNKSICGQSLSAVQKALRLYLKMGEFDKFLFLYRHITTLNDLYAFFWRFMMRGGEEEISPSDLRLVFWPCIHPDLSLVGFTATL